MAPRYVVGIDLGTTHSALAVSPSDRRQVELVPIPQLVAPGEVSPRELLPSFLYLPAQGELAAADRTLPWGESEVVVGELARRLGAKVPTRLVASAKSWLCHGGVSRRAPLLPWSAPEGEPHVSPSAAQVRYLEHLRAAWEQRYPEAPLVQQEVIVTVPASFDEEARELTAQAARAAGLGEVRLLEEPQAAFYDALSRPEAQAALASARLVLVIDVGGGTTDLTLLRVGDGGQHLERIAVGGHLMLGGDNMDAALAHHLVERAELTRRLDPAEWSALVQSARHAKEQLLAEDAPEQVVVALQERGSRLVAGTRTLTLRRDEAHAILLDGFLPHTGPGELAERGARLGLTTLGLPFTADTAIPRQVCSFLRRHAEAARAAGADVRDGLPRPDLLLLNGGVFKAQALQERLSQVLAGWYGAPVPLLPHTSLDTAVARGAATYALARRGVGKLVHGGTARAYYVGVAGPRGEPLALCVAPRGLTEGGTAAIAERLFELVLDRPVRFPLYGYTGDRADAAGTLVPASDELEVLRPIETVLRSRGETARTAQGGVPVRLSATLGDKGGLELYLVTVELPPRRWRLDFALGAEEPARPGQARAAAPADEGPSSPQLERAGEAVVRALSSSDVAAVKGLREQLETMLGPRGQWPAPTCRRLADALLEHERARARSATHELAWLRLTSWCLRPGRGVAGDPERLRRLWQVHGSGPRHKDKAIAAEWWTLWRRVAPGLGRAEHEALYAEIAPSLPRGHAEQLLLLAALERLPGAVKESAGRFLLERAAALGSFLPLGRLGARAPLDAEDAELVVRPAAAEAWLHSLLLLDWKKSSGAALAASLLAQATGDAGRDVPKALRDTVAARLLEVKAPPTWLELMAHAGRLSDGDAARVLGDSLPPGLRLG